MSDEAVIVKGTGTIFLAGPPLVKAATGEEVTAEELGGARRPHAHLRRRGPPRRGRRARARDRARDRRRTSAAQGAARRPRRRRRSRLYDPKEIYGVLPGDVRQPYDVREVIARLVDGSRFHEFKARYGTTLVCGFARISRVPRRDRREQRHPLLRVGPEGDALHRDVRAAQGPARSSCRTSPASWSGKDYERGGIAKDGAKMVHAVANAAVPKFTVIIGGSFGAGNYGMCGRAYGPRFLWMWPNARISVMGGAQAASVLSTVKQDQLARGGQARDDAGRGRRVRAARRARSTRPRAIPYYSTARLWDDGVLDPAETRRGALARALRRLQRADPGDRVRRLPDVGTQLTADSRHSFRFTSCNPTPHDFHPSRSHLRAHARRLRSLHGRRPRDRSLRGGHRVRRLHRPRGKRSCRRVPRPRLRVRLVRRAARLRPRGAHARGPAHLGPHPLRRSPRGLGKPGPAGRARVPPARNRRERTHRLERAARLGRRQRGGRRRDAGALPLAAGDRDDVFIPLLQPRGRAARGA